MRAYRWYFINLGMCVLYALFSVYRAFDGELWLSAIWCAVSLYFAWSFDRSKKKWHARRQRAIAEATKVVESDLIPHVPDNAFRIETRWQGFFLVFERIDDSWFVTECKP